MRSSVLRLILGIGLIGYLTSAPLSDPQAESTYQGPEKCQKCHKAELEVWEDSKHAKSLKTVHRTKEAKAIVKAIGGKRIKTSDTCTMCHYTMVAKGDKTKAAAGPSCESCHGAASEWMPIHNNFGEGVKLEDEPAEHKAQRVEKATAAGMVWPRQTFDVASNCLSCHAMAREALSGETIATMLEAGHPINPEFELVRYSQGSVRHRFYPPDLTRNSEMAADELSRYFIAGHAASLVVATRVRTKTDHAKYAAAQEARIAAAKAALEAIQGEVPEAGALIQDPSEANARALVAAIAGKDLSGSVGGLLPSNDSHK